MVEEDSVQYWRQKYEETNEELQRVQADFSEFQETAKELEAALEQELKEAEAKSQEQQAKVNKLTKENELLKQKVKEFSAESVSLQNQIASLRSEKAQWLETKRQLEQTNDDLERKERMADATVQSLREALEKAIESSVWLQGEFEDFKRKSEETIQRQLDEIKGNNNKHSHPCVHSFFCIVLI
eukprot:GEZU01009604.1.p1 GENE.GEZU01009604.1~~GEZU01009604.1.p1  ORF type:complete len:184 (-),score=41.78 GEZU01009604.1:57-608(-)